MMKERTNTKYVAPQKVKGTVLFTVICVMMVLVVFLMGALALATTANKRAMKSYSEAQTQATAKAGVHALMSAIQNDVSVARAASELGAGGTTAIELGEDDIQFESDLTWDPGLKKYVGTPSGALGKITHAEIRYVGHKYIMSGDELKDKAVIKFSATAQQGDAESTYSVYMLRDIVSEGEGGGGGGGGGFVTTGSAGASNHTSAFGGTYIGFSNDLVVPSNLKAGDTLTGAVDYYPGNEAILETPINITGNLQSKNITGKLDIVLCGPGKGLTVWGDIDFTNEQGAGIDILTVNGQKDKDVMKDLPYTQIPYIFANGAFKIRQANMVIGAPDVPLNIFCGYFEHTKDWGALKIYADLICYQADKTSTLGGTYGKSEDGNSPGSNLEGWVANVVSPIDPTIKGYTAGNVFTKGSLKTQSGGAVTNEAVDPAKAELKDAPHAYTANGTSVTVKNEYLIRGNVVVEQDLILDGGVTVIDGNCTVKGDITGSGTLVVTGTLFNANATSVTLYANKQTTGGQEFPANYEYNKVLNGTGADKEGKIISKPDEIMSSINPYNTTTSVPASEASKVANNLIAMNGNSIANTTGSDFYSYSASSKKLTITDSCTLRGKVDGVQIYVDPHLVDNPDFDSSRAESATNPKKVAPTMDNPDYDASQPEDPVFNPKKVVKPICIKIDGGLKEADIPPSDDPSWYGITEESKKTFTMMNDAKILLNDLNGCAVDFFLTSDMNIQCNGKAVWTEKLNQYCAGSGFYIATDSRYARTDVPQLSNIGISFYADTNHHVFNTGNSSNIIAANICMPYTKMIHKPGSPGIYSYCGPTAKLYYNNLELQEEDGTYTGRVFSKGFTKDVGILGCCIVEELETDNNWVMVYVPRKSVKASTAKKDLEDALLVGWQTLYYENY